MGLKSKRKGYSFEHEMEKAFTEATGVQWVRTPRSGGWGKSQTKGDLIAPSDSKYASIFVECKKGEGFTLWSSLFDHIGPIWQWWDKAIEQATKESKVPVLLLGRNHMASLALFHEGDFRVSTPIFYRARDNNGDVILLATVAAFLRSL
jgi:hypothetical protein